MLIKILIVFKLLKLIIKHPELRILQLLSNILRESYLDYVDFFYITDKMLLKSIERFEEKGGELR